MSHMTPRDTVDALRLLARFGMVEKGDDDDIKATMQSHATRYIVAKRDGKTDLEFDVWFETADIQALMEAEEKAEAEEDQDPTA
jgi:hypothetical protein